MAFEVEGKLHKIYPTEQKSQSFVIREFVVEVPDGNYPQYVKFQCVQDRCSVLDNYREGERVKVSFDLRGREWQGKFFTTLNVWRIDRAGAGEESATTNNSTGADDNFPSDPFPNYADTPKVQNANFDDLPF